MAVRDAVERQSNTPARVTPYQAIKQKVEEYTPVIMRALPRQMRDDAGVEHFLSTLLTAVRNEPKLMKCEPASVIAAAVKAAQLGLEPNDGRGLCCIIPYGNQAQYQTMYKGAIELARRSGLVGRVVARVVHEGDTFEQWDDEDGVHFKYRKAVGDAGPAVLWFAAAWEPSGGPLMDIAVLDREKVEYHRAFSKMPNGQMWSKSYDAAALKSAVWELLRLLPQSVNLASALEADERTYRMGDTDAPDPEPLDVGEATHAIDTSVSEPDADTKWVDDARAEQGQLG